MLYLFALGLSAGFAVAVAAFAGALGQAKAIAAGLEGIARQPEAAGRIQFALLIGLAFIESLTIYTLVVCILLLGRLPVTADVVRHLAK
jgi:F-type H+-transporting ATPase subunit c